MTDKKTDREIRSVRIMYRDGGQVEVVPSLFHTIPDRLSVALMLIGPAPGGGAGREPKEEREMVTMGLVRSRLSGTLSGTMEPEQEDQRTWEHIGNIVFPMPPAIVIPTVIGDASHD